MRLGSVVAVTDSDRCRGQRTNCYDVYGARTTSGSGLAFAFGFTGRRAGLDGAQLQPTAYMDSATGRWLRPDPKKMINGPNIYQYVNSNPAMFTDPMGRRIVIYSPDQRILDAKHEIEMTPLGAFYLEALERSPVEFRVVSRYFSPRGTVWPNRQRQERDAERRGSCVRPWGLGPHPHQPEEHR